MRIIRYMAPDTRQALRGIREQLGDDAVILSSKRTPEGVELTVAVDFDAARLENAASALVSAPAEKPGAPARATPAAAPPSEPAPRLRPAPAANSLIASVAAQLRAPAAAPAARAPAPARARAPARVAPAAQPAGRHS